MKNFDAENRIDQMDLNLLKVLQQNALTNTMKLGDAVGLSATAAKRRVDRMRKDGTIRADVSIVDPERVGYPIFTLVFVDLERDRHDIMQNFKRAVVEEPRIVQAFYTTGDVDFVLLVASRSLADYERFTQAFFWEKPDIKSFKTMVVMDAVKLGLALPLES